MISILKKLKEAIELSRSYESIDINEIIDNSHGRLFLKSRMSNSALVKWQEVIDEGLDWLSVNFKDIDGDSISPNEGTEGDVYIVKIEYPCFNENIYLLTLEGWRYFLHDDEKVNKYNNINLLCIDISFSTHAFNVSPWSSNPENIPNENKEALTPKKVRTYVKVFNENTSAPSTIEPWVLKNTNNIPNDDPAFKIWRSISNAKLIICIPNEISLNSDGKIVVGFYGKPPKNLIFNKDKLKDEVFDNIQEAILWIYFEGNEIEIKHTFLSSEIAREWALNINYCNGINTKLPSALESAKLLYKAHVRSSGKETLKTLGDLRKTLIDDVQKVIQQTRDIANGIWKDVALSIATIVLKYTVDSSKQPNHQLIYSYIFFAVGVYIIASFALSLFINNKFNGISEDNRKIWRRKLYLFLDDADYKLLAKEPIDSALRNYRNVCIASGVIILITSILLFKLAFDGLDTTTTKEFIQTTLSSATEWLRNFNLGVYFNSLCLDFHQALTKLRQ
ncbi:hypothetical protein AB6825_01070 [Serratia proteamaculans]|uniref:hypothetical protein n=1 Tax=Serratia proteamaculans TaxID=28151 RepID=UPI0039BDE470